MSQPPSSTDKRVAAHPDRIAIKDQNGALKVKDGEVLPDKDVLGMNWLAEGIEGKLPS